MSFRRPLLKWFSRLLCPILCAVIFGLPSKADAQLNYEVKACDHALKIIIRSEWARSCYLLIDGHSFRMMLNGQNTTGQIAFKKLTPEEHLATEKRYNWQRCSVFRENNVCIYVQGLEGNRGPSQNAPLKLRFSRNPCNNVPPELWTVQFERELTPPWRSALHHIWMYPFAWVALPIKNPKGQPDIESIKGVFADIVSMLEYNGTVYVDIFGTADQEGGDDSVNKGVSALRALGWECYLENHFPESRVQIQSHFFGDWLNLAHAKGVAPAGENPYGESKALVYSDGNYLTVASSRAVA